MAKIFFSWQSDQSRQSCKDAVLNALNAVAAKLNSEVSEADRLEVTSDTQGVPGSPEIFNTICERIDECDVFVADLTIVATLGTKKKRKVLPNANVLIEYGYALKSKGRSKLISVWNTAFFEPKIEELPFNLKHARAPHQFALRDEQSTETAQRATRKLEEFFYEAVRGALKSSPPDIKPAEFQGQPALASDPSTFLLIGEALTRDDDFSGRPLKVVVDANKGNIYARLIPKKALVLSKTELRNRIKSSPGLSISMRASAGSDGNNQFGHANYAIASSADTGEHTVLDYVQFFASGEVWCVNGSELLNVGDIWENTIFSVTNMMLGVVHDWLAGDKSNTQYSLVVGVSGLKNRRVIYGHSQVQKSSPLYIDHIYAKFEQPKDVSNQTIKEALWRQVQDEV